MTTCTPRRPMLVALAAIGVMLLTTAGRVEQSILVKIERQQPASAAAQTLADVNGLQELQSGWVAEASSEVVARLRAAGLALTVLDPSPTGKRYFVVLATAASSDASKLSSEGSVLPLEDRVWLVASADDNLRERLPREFAVVPLSLSPAAWLRPSFDTAGRPRSVSRPTAAASVQAPDARIAEAVGDVSGERIAGTIRRLESYESRYAPTAGLTAAGNYLHDQLRQLGLQAEYDDFTFGAANSPATNIIATLPGRSSPSEVVLITAHYDSTSDGRPAVAPGADDNASGTAAVLEAARVLAARPFDFSIRFIAFSAEEAGLYGSRHYAQLARARGERIIGAINLDMVAYADRLPEELEVFANPTSEWLAARFESSAAAYAALPTRKTVNASVRASDHAPFWDAGYSAVLCIEDYPLTNPFYHRTSDRFETLNMEFATGVTKASVAVVAGLAQPLALVPAPTDLAVQTDTLRSLFARARRNTVSWSPSASAAGYYVYRATSSHGSYRRLNASPVRGTSFTDDLVPASLASYYVVTAVDAQGRESNYSAEAGGQ